MALCDLHYFSPALNKMVGAMIVLPEDAELTGPFPVFYLLHGSSDDYTAWIRRTSIERYVQDLPLIVVMPDGGHGFYTDAESGYAYDTAITVDLVGYVDRMFPTDRRRAGRVIGGLSMGGYGALKLAFRHPDLFCSAVSHSGALAWAHDDPPTDPERRERLTRIAGAHPAGGPHDLFALAAQLDRARMPAVRIDCGTEDRLIDANRRFHAHLDTLDVPHEYAEYPGGHTWSYWDVRVQEAIAFHARILGIRGTPDPV